VSHLTEEAAKRVWFINLPEDVEPVTPQDRIADLERENAALRDKVEFAGQWLGTIGSQNTALRKVVSEAKVVTEYSKTTGRRQLWEGSCWLRSGDALLCINRADIDAAMKEAQP